MSADQQTSMPVWPNPDSRTSIKDFPIEVFGRPAWFDGCTEKAQERLNIRQPDDALWFTCWAPMTPDVFGWPLAEAAAWLHAEITMMIEDEMPRDWDRIPDADDADELYMAIEAEADRLHIGDGWHRTAAAIVHGIPAMVAVVGVSKANFPSREAARTRLAGFLERQMTAQPEPPELRP